MAAGDHNAWPRGVGLTVQLFFLILARLPWDWQVCRAISGLSVPQDTCPAHFILCRCAAIVCQPFDSIDSPVSPAPGRRRAPPRALASPFVTCPQFDAAHAVGKPLANLTERRAQRSVAAAFAVEGDTGLPRQSASPEARDIREYHRGAPLTGLMAFEKDYRDMWQNECERPVQKGAARFPCEQRYPTPFPFFGGSNAVLAFHATSTIS